MNPIPPGAIPTNLLVVHGYLEVLLVLTVISLVVLFALSLRELRGVERWRDRLRCPVRLRMARVDFRIGGDGKPTDVLRCSIFGRRPITCGKACLHHAVTA
jgi:hypothetical protein